VSPPRDRWTGYLCAACPVDLAAAFAAADAAASGLLAREAAAQLVAQLGFEDAPACPYTHTCTVGWQEYCPVPRPGLERRVSELVNSDARPRPTAGHFLCLRTSLFLFNWRVVGGVVCTAV
jgi:hypothetical protein